MTYMCMALYLPLIANTTYLTLAVICCWLCSSR